MSAETQIPEDIMKTANMLGADIRHHIAVSNREMIEHDPIVDAMIVKAIHAERKRCASIARDATMMTGAPIEEIGDEVAAAVLSQPKASKFWMVYGVGQRGSTYQHRSKALAQEEAKRLAGLHPGNPVRRAGRCRRLLHQRPGHASHQDHQARSGRRPFVDRR